MGGDTCRRRWRCSHRFQFTPPHGGRPQRPRYSPRHRYFNSRPRMGGDPQTTAASAAVPFQFTPPHGGRPTFWLFCVMLIISIHAPAWGATSMSATAQAPSTFQFTPPHGGRPGLNVDGVGLLDDFNSRPRMGGDMEYAYNPIHNFISIHAPAWGATAQLHNFIGNHTAHTRRSL